MKDLEEEMSKIPSTQIPIGLIDGKVYHYMCKEDILKMFRQWISERIPEDDKDVPCDEVEEDSPEYNRAIGWNQALKLVRERLGVF